MKKVLRKMAALLASILMLLTNMNVLSVLATDDLEPMDTGQRVDASYNIDAPAFSLPTLSGATVTQSTYGPKTQLIVFYNASGGCGNSNRALESIASSYWVSNNNIKVIAIDANGESASSVKSFKEQKAHSNNNIVWAYNGRRTMWDYVNTVGGYGGSVTYTVCAIVQNGKILEFWDSDNKTKIYFNTSGAPKLSPLQYDYDLEKAAMERAKELAVYFAQIRPNKKYYDSITQRNNTFCIENRMLGNDSAASVFESWIEEDKDYSGQNDRRNMLSNGFFHSQEFMNKNLDNTEFVKVLYRTFLGREYDQQGLENWVGQLDRREKTRDQVMEGFAYSQEFNSIMTEYGL